MSNRILNQRIIHNLYRTVINNNNSIQSIFHSPLSSTVPISAVSTVFHRSFGGINASKKDATTATKAKVSKVAGKGGDDKGIDANKQRQSKTRTTVSTAAQEAENEDRLEKLIPMLFAKPIDPRTPEEKAIDLESEKRFSRLFMAQTIEQHRLEQIKLDRRQQALLMLPPQLREQCEIEDISLPPVDFPHPLDWLGRHIVSPEGGLKGGGFGELDKKQLKQAEEWAKAEKEERKRKHLISVAKKRKKAEANKSKNNNNSTTTTTASTSSTAAAPAPSTASS